MTDEQRGGVGVDTDPTAVLLIDGLSKTYPGQVALDDAHLEVRAGEVHALVGQNGSGKSTLIKLLGGYVQADHGGSVRFAGRPVDLWHLAADDRERIRIVHQDLGLVPALSAIENLGLGRGYITGPAGRILWRAEAARAQELLLRFGLAPDVRQPVGGLSAAEQAAIAIVRALQDWDADRPGLLVLDEPTASLNRREVDALFREVRRVASLGAGVLFVSHMLDEVLDLADRVTVLRDGKVVAAGVPTHHLDQRALVDLIVGRSVSDLYPAVMAPPSGTPVLEVESVFGLTLRAVSFKIHRGEVVGFAGLVGSGRDEIASAIAGMSPRFAGKVLVDKKKVFASPRDSLLAGVALVPADRKGLGLDPEDRLAEHVPLPRLGPFQRRTRLHRREMRGDVSAWVERLDVQPPMLDRRMSKFSGGNQQKAVLARWLRTRPKVLLLDEPTQGVDVGAKAAIYHQIAEAAREGVAVLIASSDADELVHLCDRVFVLRAGSISAELAGPNLTEERLVAETLGATSDRKTMKIAREPVLTTVVRDDPPEEIVEDAPAPAPQPVAKLAVPAVGGRLSTMVRRALHRIRKQS